ncbi:MAG: hypothetical protein GX768_06165 [Chloroflexi bacterium]|jgi:hypothetical protein|nr:hypothetical protein [Anaerolineaceae bacterium]NLC13609.1 hypothetical protein [Chloroflexota bacterium]
MPEQPSTETKPKTAHVLFWLGMAFYLLTRLIALDKFPIYFFSDEAIQTMSAFDLINNGFRDFQGKLFPVYFQNGQQYNLSLSVWLQVLIAWLPRSVWLTRALPAMISLVFPLSVSLWARDFLRSKHWWLVPLLISALPAWFLHSRTAFETSLGVSFYSLFLFFYLRYRSKNRKNLLLALLFGACAFYSYAPLQLVVVATGLVLLIVDWRYHFHDTKSLLFGLVTLLLLALPYILFQLNHQQALSNHLHLLRSYWLSDIPLLNKLGIFLGKWLQGLNPLYWFFPNQTDLVRHQMKGLGHLPWFFLPFFLVGLWQSIKNWKEPACRLALIALFVAPLGAAIADIAITRVLVMVVPFSLLIFLGLNQTLEFLRNKNLLRNLPAYFSAIAIAIFSIWMGWYAIVKGPLWYSDYGLYGMQWGGQQLSQKISEFIQDNPQSKLKLSPAWANNTDIIMRYFLGDPLPLEIGTIREFDLYYQELDPNQVFIVTPEEYSWLVQNPKFDQIEVLDSQEWPDGRKGFTFLRLAYSPQARQIFEVDLQQRRQPEVSEFDMLGQQVNITYSRLDLGTIAHIFDGDNATPLRTFEANPLVISIEFPQPIELQKVTAMVGAPATRLCAAITLDKSGQKLIFAETLPSSDQIRPITISFGETYQVSQLKIWVESINEPEPTHVHLWELILE